MDSAAQEEQKRDGVRDKASEIMLYFTSKSVLTQLVQEAQFIKN